MPIQVKTTKQYKGKCSECSWEGREHSTKEAAIEELKRHQKFQKLQKQRRAEEGRPIKSVKDLERK